MGLRWSSILVDWRCWIRLKKSSLGMVLDLWALSTLGSGDRWSLIRALYEREEREEKMIGSTHNSKSNYPEANVQRPFMSGNKDW
jgi:hypothetical protein